ncbi:MAG: ankyrin repeat domain-containing protein [Alphaproteobacteria bacterium]|nr:ankyrin repeat domain-containing protein [Alphaproteobacteria bacterium]
MDDNTDDSLIDSIPNGMSWRDHDDRLLAEQTMEKLVASGNVNRKNKDGQTPLHRFVKEWRLKDINFLLENGADVNVQDQNGDTPLHFAVYNGYMIPRELIIHGADLDVQNNHGFTPLMNACVGKNGYHGDYRAAALFIAHGANLDLQNEDGNTALILSCYPCHDWFDYMLENTKRLVAAGADMNKQNNDGDTALIIALRNGEYEKAYFLISCGARTDIQNNNGETALSITESTIAGKSTLFLEEKEIIHILNNKQKPDTISKYKSDKSKSDINKQYE